jgi:Leucine-rich repeat (LRR) protein
MKISIDFLKQESCNFDLETVFILDLSRKDLKYLDGIKECSNIEILNLSNNEINDLTGLKGLNKLQYLNLSFNQIKYLGSSFFSINLKSIS